MARTSSDPDADVANSSSEQRTAAALLRLQAPHLQPDEALRISRAMGTAAEANRQGGPGQSAAESVAAAMGRVPAGGMGLGGVNVNGYTGSMWAQPGSYSAARPVTPAASAAAAMGYQRPLSANDRADRILRGRFGPPPNDRAQVDIASAMGTRSVPVARTVADAMSGNPVNLAPNDRTVADAMTPGYGAPAGYGDPLAGTRYAGRVGGTMLDPAYRSLLLQDLQGQVDDRRALADSREAMMRSATAQAKQESTNRAALVDAMRPVYNGPSYESVKNAFNSGGAIPVPGVTNRDPTVAEMMRGYAAAGGAPTPTATTIMKAMGAATPFSAHEETLPSGAQMIYNTPRSAIPNPLQARPARTTAPKNQPASGVEEVQIGPQKYFFHHESKQYFDANGKMVAKPTAAGGKESAADTVAKIKAAAAAGGGAASAAPAKSDKFEAGKTYTDAAGNRATYVGDGKWQHL